MAGVKRLDISGIRNHANYSCEFAPGVTLIHGDNGAGKTSLLESVYIAATGLSFRASDREILSRYADWYRVDAIDSSGDRRRIVYDNRGERPIKSLIIDDKKSARMPARYRLPIVIFEPDDLRLVHGSPTRRRQYLDRLISGLDPRYGTQLRRYSRALLQRNKLLKHTATADQIFPWDVILSDCAAYIIAARLDVCMQIDQLLTQYYREISSDNTELRFSYSRGRVSSNQLVEAYRQSLPRDLMLGNTSIGPHRDDFTVTYDDQLAADVVSRGENRTITLALKYIEASLVEASVGDRPIILLDDVFGELDSSRQRNLVHTFRDNQVILTSTHPIDDLPDGHVVNRLSSPRRPRV